MLLRKDLHRIVEHAHFVNGASLCALTFVMHDARCVHVGYVESSLLDAVAEIDVFTIHEERRIESTKRTHEFCATDHKRTDQSINSVGGVNREIGEVIPSKELRRWEETLKSEQFAKRYPRRGKSATASNLKRTVRIKNLASRYACLRVFVEELAHHR